MKILAFDLGSRFGWCFLDETGTTSGNDHCSDLLEWGDKFTKLLNKWKPNIVVLSQTNNFGFWNATRIMMMRAGIAFYICGKKGIPGVEFNDSTARKAVFGKGIKKKEVQQLRPNTQADELDAMVLAEGWQILNQEQNDKN